jgi:nicotinate phosphoribosyltransferase
LTELLSSESPTKAPMPPVITSLLDTDLYKLTMWQAMLHRHPETQAEYTFL